MDGWPIRLIVCCAIIGSTLGCGSPPAKPSYADLVVIYNAEAQELDRLEKKREELLAKIEAIVHPPQNDDAADVLKGILAAADDLRKQNEDQNEDNVPADPNELLDRTLENTDQARKLASQAVDAAMQSSTPKDAVDEEQLAALQKELDELERTIDEQKARVERARKNRDAAE